MSSSITSELLAALQASNSPHKAVGSEDLETSPEVLPPGPGRLVAWGGCPYRIRQMLRRELHLLAQTGLKALEDILEVCPEADVEGLTKNALAALRQLRRKRRFGGWKRLPSSRSISQSTQEISLGEAARPIMLCNIKSEAAAVEPVGA